VGTGLRTEHRFPAFEVLCASRERQWPALAAQRGGAMTRYLRLTPGYGVLPTLPLVSAGGTGSRTPLFANATGVCLVTEVAVLPLLPFATLGRTGSLMTLFAATAGVCLVTEAAALPLLPLVALGRIGSLMMTRRTPVDEARLPEAAFIPVGSINDEDEIFTKFVRVI
jgi:hypothetical protein